VAIRADLSPDGDARKLTKGGVGIVNVCQLFALSSILNIASYCNHTSYAHYCSARRYSNTASPARPAEHLVVSPMSV